MSNETFDISTPTEDILTFVESVLFNPDYEDNEDVLQATLVPLYGALVVFHLAGYDREQLLTLLEDSVDTAYPLMQEVRAQYMEMMKRMIN